MRGRTWGFLLLACGAACSVGACDDNWWGYDNTPPYPPHDYCSQYTTCDSCTPVGGCGWCATSTGGACRQSPNECPGTTFRWSWDQSGCFLPDGGTSAQSYPRLDGGSTQYIYIDPVKPDATAPSDAAAATDSSGQTSYPQDDPGPSTGPADGSVDAQSVQTW